MLKFEFQQNLLFRHKHLNIQKDLNYLKEKYEVQNDLVELNEPIIPILCSPPTNSLLAHPNDQRASVSKLEMKNSLIYAGLSSHLQPQNIMNSLPSPSNINNSHSHQTSLNTSSEDIVLIGSSVPTSIANQSHQLAHNQQNIPNHPQIHSQILNRLQQQVSQHPTQSHYIDILNTANDSSKVSVTNSLSTPEKQRVQSNQTKKRTPRRQQSRNATNTANSNNQSNSTNQSTLNVPQQQMLASQSKAPLIGQPSQMINQMTLQHQKLINSQQQQNIPQRSANSPMLGQVPQPAFQTNSTNMYQSNPNNRPVVNHSNISQNQQNNMIGQTSMNQQPSRITVTNNQQPVINPSNNQNQTFQTSSQYLSQPQLQQNQQSNIRTNIIQSGNRNNFAASSVNLNSNSNQLVNPNIQATMPSHSSSGLNIQAQQQRKMQIQNHQVINNTQSSQQQQQKPVYSNSQNLAGQSTIYGSMKQPIQPSINSPMQTVQRTTTPDSAMVMQQQQQLKYPPQAAINPTQPRMQLQQTILPQAIQSQSQQTRMQFNSNVNQNAIQSQQGQMNQSQIVNQQNLNWQQRQQPTTGIQRQQQYQTQQQFNQKHIPNQMVS
jgi:hypothetical protein